MPSSQKMQTTWTSIDVVQLALLISARHLMDVKTAFEASPPTMTPEEARIAQQRAQLLFDRALATLDLSKFPNATRRDLGTEKALMLKEILDRAPLPRIPSIPGPKLVNSMREAGKVPVRRIFPNTNVEIEERLVGPSAGKFRFSGESIADAARSYKLVSSLAYHGQNNKGVWETRFAEQYDSLEISPGFLYCGIDSARVNTQATTLLQ